MKQTKRKPLVLVTLANSFYTDTRVKQEVSTLNNAGYKVVVLAWDRTAKFKDFNSEKLIVKNTKLFSTQKFHKLKFLMSAIIFQFLIFKYGLKYFRHYGHLLIHVNDFNTLIGACLLKWLSPRRIKIVYDVHELTPAVYEEWYNPLIGKIAGKLEKLFIQYTDQIITVSQPIKNYLSKIVKKEIWLVYNFPMKNLIPNLSRKEARNRLNLNEDDYIVIYVGTLRLDVALVELIKAMKIILSKNIDKIKFYIIGDGPLYSKFQHIVKKEKLSSHVKVLGRKSRKETLMYLKASNLSYSVFKVRGLNSFIGMPWKLFESLSCGIPVLVLDKTFTSKYVIQRNLGITTSNMSPEKITEAILKAYNKKIKNDVEEKDKYIWENQEKDFLKIYSSLL